MYFNPKIQNSRVRIYSFLIHWDMHLDANTKGEYGSLPLPEITNCDLKFLIYPQIPLKISVNINLCVLFKFISLGLSQIFFSEELFSKFRQLISLHETTSLKECVLFTAYLMRLTLLFTATNNFCDNYGIKALRSRI